MEPPAKIIKLEDYLSNSTRNESQLQELTDTLCNLIRNNEITSLIMEKTKKKFKSHHFIQIFRSMDKKQS